MNIEVYSSTDKVRIYLGDRRVDIKYEELRKDGLSDDHAKKVMGLIADKMLDLKEGIRREEQL